MSAPLPSVFVIGSSATLLMHPHLEAMLRGICRYSRKGHEEPALAAALHDTGAPADAVAGDTSMILAYLAALGRTGRFAADAALVHAGLHDIKRDRSTGAIRVPVERYKANVEVIADWFAGRRIRLLWLRSGPLDEALHNARSRDFARYEADLLACNRAADEVLGPRGVPVLDLEGFTRRLGPMARLLKDHVHFTDEVVRLQAAFVAGCVAGYLANPHCCPGPG